MWKMKSWGPFDSCYEATAGENASLMASSITNTRRMEIKTPDVVIHVDPDRARACGNKDH